MIPIYLKNMAGELIHLEVEPSASLLEIAQLASTLDPEQFPPGRTKVMRMDKDEDEDEEKKPWEEDEEKKPWEEDEILMVMVSSSLEGVLNPYVIDLVRTLQERQETLLIHQRQIKALRGKIASRKKGLDVHALETQLDQAVGAVEEMTEEIATMESDLVTLRQEAQQNIQEDLKAVNQRLVSLGIRKEYSAVVYIKMLDKIIPIGIHMYHYPTIIALAFLDQMAYDHREMDRLLFLDENSKDIRQPWEWEKLFRTVEEIPIIRLIVQEKPEERETRIVMLQKILLKRGLRTDLDDEAVWAMYSSWSGFYTLKTNRHTKLLRFVLAHPDVFVS